MPRLKSLWVAAVLLVTLTPLLAQQETPFTPPTPIPLPPNPVVLPIPGLLALGNSSLIDTVTGSITSFDIPYGYPNWNPYGNNILFAGRGDGAGDGLLQLNGSAIEAFSINTTPQRSTDELRQNAFAGWSSDGQRFMRLVTLSKLDSNGVYQSTYTLERVNLQTGEIDRFTDFVQRMPMHKWFDIPSDADPETLLLNLIHAAEWNPVYTDWVFIQPIGYGKRIGSGEDMGVFDVGLFNLVTQQYISLSTLLPQTVASFTPWSTDGRRIAMNTMTGITILDFRADEGQRVHLKIIADSVDSIGQAVHKWMNVGDLLLTGQSPGSYPVNREYTAIFVAQVIDNQWFSREFIALSGQGSYVSFRFTGTPEQEAALSCMFWDEVYPPRLTPGLRGRVTFTDGTPSRLRADHSTSAPVMAQMPEGTTFDVTGPAYCVDNYRWWPLRLDNGTVGWAAEGTASEAWLEPAP